MTRTQPVYVDCVKVRDLLVTVTFPNRVVKQNRILDQRVREFWRYGGPKRVVGRDPDPRQISRAYSAVRRTPKRPKRKPFDHNGICAVIRIGVRLAAEPLPHHRAYGSVHGGSVG